MIEIFSPDFYVESLTDIRPRALSQKNITGLIVDLDNTLVAWNRTSPESEVLNWLQEVKDEGIKLCIVSNSLGRRVLKISDELCLPAVSKAIKPRKKAFREALNLLNRPLEEVAVVGDQVLTDVLGGNRLGLLTILVVPESSKDFITTRFVRFVERLILRRLQKKELIGDPDKDMEIT